ncbi:hypothetical protein S40285_03472 [Stachybotrys chlorohalonatus IBT 40285]|uniref:Uncharacterized protein n=1 Tax=Stachybotrys chlorohalonatus (strain IBT 40285) TaxID=1283841 RepID=A0A084QCK9_STAC4|nr:hypothetical protein S40285_03472 [Stachybotrys chlorohalonata IBT 40285]
MNSEGSAEQPPAYAESSPDEIIPPATLHIAGRFIHCSDPNSPPLYQLSHIVGYLSGADRSVTLERLDYTIKTQDGMPKVSSRSRHIYDLKHPPALWFPTFVYYAESMSRQSLGSVGLAMYHPKKLSSTKAFRVHRAAHRPNKTLVEKELLFTAVPTKDSAVLFEWSDAQGQLIAREVEEDNFVRLIVGAAMGKRLRDALVASWVSRIWWELSLGNYRTHNWHDAYQAWKLKGH